ncbi:phosphoribosylanthranilate isomerase [Enterococcus sp. UD-01]|jgi:phosphoribosylanthranilate isomerase|uniref:phosphoribosylanthranilate isomerase n=1 Tax=Enterococcus sp. UD-01 TaxID=3373911 RepID=UPI003833623E
MKVKICGLKTTEQVNTAVVNGADYLGFVFAESKRQVTPEQVRSITTHVPKRIKKVGVFVSPERTEVERIIQLAGLDLIQLHGKLKAIEYSVPWIQALAVGQELEPAATAEYILFDAPPKEFMGGNGKPFDWQKLDVNKWRDKKIFIAGGLTAQNVQEARRIFQPYAVDVSSGVETKGEKDSAKIAAFLKKAKEENNV